MRSSVSVSALAHTARMRPALCHYAPAVVLRAPACYSTGSAPPGPGFGPNAREEPKKEDEQEVRAAGFRSFSIARPIESLILRSRITRDVDMARFLAKAASIAVYSVAGVTLLGTVGVDTKPLIAGFGVTGFTIGFALKEIATNFLSGVLLVLNKPFQKGQYLKVMGAAAGQNLEGEVESIDARYVLLRSRERGLLLVPAVIVYTNPLMVLAKSPFQKTA